MNWALAATGALLIVYFGADGIRSVKTGRARFIYTVVKRSESPFAFWVVTFQGPILMAIIGLVLLVVSMLVPTK